MKKGLDWIILSIMFSTVSIHAEKHPGLFKGVYALSEERLEEIAGKLSRFYSSPLVLVVTCLRVELYIEKENVRESEVVKRALSLPLTGKSLEVEVFHGKDAIRHLYIFSTGILSPLYGDDTIPGQLESALRRSKNISVSSSSLNRLFNSAIAFSRNEKSFVRENLIDEVLVDRVSNYLSSFESVLVIGSGGVARRIGEVLLKSGVKVTMTLRDAGKTELAVPGVIVKSYDERRSLIASSDVVLSASSGLYYTLDEDDMNLVSGKVLVDIASPPDLPDSFHALTKCDFTDGESERRVLEKVSSDALAAVEKLEKEISSKDDSSFGEDLSDDAWRRMRKILERRGLWKDEEFRMLFSSSVKNAYISIKKRREKI